MNRKLAAILTSLSLLFSIVGCSNPQIETTTAPTTVSTTPSTVATTEGQVIQQTVKTYPGSNKYSDFDNPTIPPKGIYSTTGKINASVGVLYLISGTMMDYVDTNVSDIAFLRVRTPGGTAIFMDPVSMLANNDEYARVLTAAHYEQLREYYPLPEPGEQIMIYGEYQGMSSRVGCPSFIYGTEDYMTDVLMDVCADVLEDLVENDETLPDPSTETTEPPALGTFENPYTAGMYKVGHDLPEGEYLFFPVGDRSAYVCAYTDSTKEEIIENENTRGPFFMTVKSGQYLQAKNCVFILASGYVIEINEDGSFSEGMYRVGIDIPAGEYKLVPDDDRGYWCLYNSTEIPFDIHKNDNFEGSTYVTVKEGQYLLISRCTAFPVI